MTFAEQLNRLLEELDVSRAALSRASGLSTSTLARYCAGEREPDPSGERLRSIADGLASLAAQKGASYTREEILALLRKPVDNGLQVEYDVFLENLKSLLRVLDIRSVSLAHALSFDPSHISKVLSGQRRPGNVPRFVSETVTYIAEHMTTARQLNLAAELFGCEPETLRAEAARREAVRAWLGSEGNVAVENPIGGFLQKMDEFDLEAFIRQIRFDEIRIPSVPIQLPTTKIYTGLGPMMESELDFLKATALSKSTEDCILYSDMPIEEMARDPSFPKKWMFGMAALLKKGLRLHIVHDVHRPFGEMMLGLEGYIPMYMTGLISPYYLPQTQGGAFRHLLKVSGAAALEGGAMNGYQAEGRYVLTKAKDEVRFYRQKAERLLEQALPLMEIYGENRRQAFRAFAGAPTAGETIRAVCSAPPVCAMSPELLREMLQNAGVSDRDAAEAERYRAASLEGLRRLAAQNAVTLVVPAFTEEQIAETPPRLALSEIFFTADAPYTPETYARHLAETADLAARLPGLRLETDPDPAFRNISYAVVGDRFAVVSKNRSPAIHFVIRHKKMIRAIRNFIPAIREPQIDGSP